MGMSTAVMGREDLKDSLENHAMEFENLACRLQVMSPHSVGSGREEILSNKTRFKKPLEQKFLLETLSNKTLVHDLSVKPPGISAPNISRVFIRSYLP